MKQKVMVVLGTRPEIIKLSPVVQELEREKHKVIVVHTEQHYDENMSRVFFEDLELRLPDYYLGVKSGTHAEQTAKMLIGIEHLILKESPDVVIVQGDTNTALAGALAAVKVLVPVVHVEAGLRSFDRRMPEEHNRVMIDHIADINLVPTTNIGQDLDLECVDSEIYTVGNTVIDVIERIAPTVERPKILEFLGIEKYALMTYHRAENLAEITHLKQTIEEFGNLDISIVFPIHPRTLKLLLDNEIVVPENMHLMEPVGYRTFIGFMKYCEYVITDSGGIQEEVTAPSIQKRVYVLRRTTERKEAYQAGYSVILRGEPKTYVGVIKADQGFEQSFSGCPYGDGTAAKQIVEIVEKIKRLE